MNKNDLLYLFQTGYNLVNLPLSMFSFITTTYYLLITNVPELLAVFPSFWVFLAASGVLGVPAVIVFGVVYVRSELFKAAQRRQPYSYLLVPREIPLNVAVSRLCKMSGLDEEAGVIDELLERSRRETFYRA